MSQLDLDSMSQKYRVVRKAVWEEATRPLNGYGDQAANQAKLKKQITGIRDLSYFSGKSEEVANRAWREIWTKIWFAGFKASVVTRFIESVNHVFDNYRDFDKPEWKLESTGFTIRLAGSAVADFLGGKGSFEGRTVIAHIPKLKKTIEIAKKFAEFRRITPEKSLPDFIANGHSFEQVWDIRDNLLSMGYKRDLTALHCMMDLGFQVIKPDIVISREFLKWGWLHAAREGIPSGLKSKDLNGKGHFGRDYLYTTEKMYRPIVDLARKIAQHTKRQDLQDDIGWVTDNPLREFDIFLVKFGQEPDPEWGLTRCLFKEDKSGKRLDMQPADVESRDTGSLSRHLNQLRQFVLR